MATIDPAHVRARLDALVTALKASGAWEVAQPSAEALADAGPFGMHTLAFEQWLRYVFVPNVEALIASNGPWPANSDVAAHATREWDGHPDPDAMLHALRELDALFEPMTAAGHKNAGWILWHRPSPTPAELDEAIAHFRAAMELAPDDHEPLANLCSTLLDAGREAEAFAEAERATAITGNGNRTAGAHNWLGWRLMNDSATLDRAITHLRDACRYRPFWGVARANLGKALELAHRNEEAYEEHAAALACKDDYDRAFSYERRSAFEARAGWFRNALTSMRAALREDEKRGGARAAIYREAIAWTETQLRAQGIDPDPGDRRAWKRACELEIPAGFLAKNEWGESLSDDVIEVERLVRAQRWADIAPHLEKLRGSDTNKLFDAAGYAEEGADRASAAGHHDDAIAIMRLVVKAYTYYAASATSGGEGIARSADVDVKRRKLLDLESKRH
jgi:uncharacterized protein YqcC (DUF446 family)